MRNGVRTLAPGRSAPTPRSSFSGGAQGGRREQPALPPLGAIRLGLIGFIIVAVSHVHAYMGPVARLRPGLLLWVVVLGSLVVAPRSVRWSNLTANWLPKLVGVLALLSVGSILTGLSMGGAGKYFLEVYGRELLTFAAMVVAIRNVRDLRILVTTYVVSIAIVVVLSFTVMEVSATIDGLQRISGNSSPYDANDMGVLFMIGIALALVVVTSSSSWAKLLGVFVLISVPGSIALTGSRGALLGMATVALALFVTVRTRSWGRKIVYVACTVPTLFIFAPEGYWEQMSTVLNPTEDYNYFSEAGRKATALRGVGYALRYPIFGIGISNFAQAEGTLSPLLRTTAPGDRVYILAPHNTFVQVAAEMGLPALVLWCVLIFGTALSLMRLSRRLPRYWLKGTPDERFLYNAATFLPVAFVGFAVTSFFVSHAYLPSFYYLIAFSTATILLSRERLRSQRGMPMTAGRGRQVHPATSAQRRWRIPSRVDPMSIGLVTYPNHT